MLWEHKVAGSNPVVPTIVNFRFQQKSVLLKPQYNVRVPEKLWTGLQSQVGWSVTTPALQKQVGGVMVAQQSPKLLVRVRILAFLPNGVCSSMVERLIVAQEVVGSSPTMSPQMIYGGFV